MSPMRTGESGPYNTEMDVPAGRKTDGQLRLTFRRVCLDPSPGAVMANEKLV